MTSSPLCRYPRFCLLLVAVLTAHGAADYATPYVFTTLAGTSSIGSADGTGSAARFFSPQDVTTDASGNIFVVDEGNHTIRKVTPAGVVTTFAGSPGLVGSDDGTGAAARFSSPEGIGADPAGNLYVADTDNHTIRKITPAGVVTTFAGLAGVTGNTDGTGNAARFNLPRKIAVDATGNLYLTESGNRDIRKITPAGVVTTVATSTPTMGSFAFGAPYGAIAVDAAGNLYVSSYSFQDAYTHALNSQDNYVVDVGFVYRITSAGILTSLWETTAYRYFGGRTSNSVASGLAINAGDQLIVADGYNIKRYAPADSSLVVVAGDGTIGGSDGPAGSAKFGFPLALAYDRTGTLYIADTGNNTVRKLSSTGTVTTIAGMTLESATTTVDGTGAQARFANPTGTAVDASGNVYVADTASHCIRKVTPAGVVTTLAGSPGVSGSADGTGTAARFSRPFGVAVDANGNVLVTDTFNHTIRRVTPSGETSTIAGTAGTGGWQDGAGAAAQFWYPLCVALDQTGNLYVTSAATVRKITPVGLVSTLAGLDNESGYVDGTGSAARFTVPTGITVDTGGNIFVTEAPGNPTIARIRKITPAGVVSTVAGADSGYADGDGVTARFYVPAGLALDTTGNLFVADSYNLTVRKVTPQGAVSTVAGFADAAGSTDGTGRDARFYYPQGIAVDSNGALYVTSGTTVRKGELATRPVITQQPQNQTMASGGNATFTVIAGGNPAPTCQWYFGSNGISGATSSTLSLPGVRSSDAGDYTVVVTNALGSVTSNKASLTVTAAPTPPAPPPTQSGGGGAIENWFLLALLALGAVRRLTKFHLA